MPGEPTSPGNIHEDHAGDSGGGDAENQISAPYAVILIQNPCFSRAVDEFSDL